MSLAQQSDTTTRRGVSRRVRMIVVVLAGLAVTWIVLGVIFYVFPSQKPATRADVVFVIGPPDSWRLQLAQQLIDDGLADNLMISVPDPDEADACSASNSVPVFCRRPDPFTTRGESRWLASMMAEHGWTSATVITTTPHVTRTQVLMGRCLPADQVNVIGRSTNLRLIDWAYNFVYQTAGFAKVALLPGC